MQEQIISASQLTGMIDNSSKGLLIVDCRPFQAFNKDRIRGAINAFCPPILKRRVGSKGFIRLEAVVAPDIRRKLRSGDYSQLVLYDDMGSGRETSDVNIIQQGLHRYSYTLQSACVLKGGFTSFRVKCPHYCDHLKSATNKEKHIPNELSFHSTSMQSPPTELLPHLYIGDEFHSANTELLHRTGITTILNVSTSCPVPMSSEFTYKRIPIRDNESENISAWFNEALQFIDSVRRQGEKILVHCKAGISRSATICIAYLMVHKSLTLDQAFNHVQARREIISPNMSFMQQLFEFERRLLVTNMRTMLMTSSPVIPSLTCAHISEMSPSINKSAQFAFNFCAISNS